MVFLSFSVLQLSFFVFADAILKNKLLKSCTKKEIDQEMMLWFRNSGDRKGGRTARARNHSRQSEKNSGHNTATDLDQESTTIP